MCRQVKRVFARPAKEFVQRYKAMGRYDDSRQYVLTSCPCGLRRYWCLAQHHGNIGVWFTGLERKDRRGVCEWQLVSNADVPDDVLDAAYASHASREDARARKESARLQRSEERRAGQPSEAQRRLAKAEAALKRWQRKRRLAETMVKKLAAKVRRHQRSVDEEKRVTT